MTTTPSSQMAAPAPTSTCILQPAKKRQKELYRTVDVLKGNQRSAVFIPGDPAQLGIRSSLGNMLGDS